MKAISKLLRLKKQYLFLFAYLYLMNVQIYAIEGGVISIPKVVFMLLVIIISSKYLRLGIKALAFGGAYYLVAFFCVSANSLNLRYSTVLYLGLFVFSFIGFYSLLRKYRVPIWLMQKAIKTLLYAYVVWLIVQQGCALVGFRDQNFTNICIMFDNPFKLNSLAIEPSHAGRIMGVLFLTYLRLDTLQNSKLSLKKFFRNNKWVVLGYMYASLTMGSSTSLLVFAVTMCFFVKRETLLIAVPVLAASYFVIPIIDWEPLNRGRGVVEAALTGDQDNVRDVDGSASVRTAFYFNTIDAFDLSDPNFVFGHGIESDQVYEVHEYNVESNLIGGIWQYGFVAYVLSLIFVYVCCCKFFSLENIIFFFFLGGGLANIAYCWGALMLFAIGKYYMEEYGLNNKKLYNK